MQTGPHREQVRYLFMASSLICLYIPHKFEALEKGWEKVRGFVIYERF